ncbi:MAG: mercury methylation corrinoid protein HgcA [Smithellaceae bacterium]|nr:mercury methylation corrinoid protein HgcA [Smithellaceae bacterium]
MSAKVFQQPFVVGRVATPRGDVPRISAIITRREQLRDYLARWNWQRMDHRLDPGLYALGHPDEQSPVLVSANYMLSFNRLREKLAGRSLWVLVLDTDGINVWCAAGKGTFGTDELVARIDATGLKDIVSHRRLVLPQLGAPGVAAHRVKKLSGFTVSYGPIRAGDIQDYLDSGRVATAQMRRMTFRLWERIVLIPVELVAAMKATLVVAGVALLVSGLAGPEGFVANLARYGIPAVSVLLIALLAGTVMGPILLPYLPGRAFSLKGALMGLSIGLIHLWIYSYPLSGWPDMLGVLSAIAVITALTSYLTMNFTGATTFTSLSGVKKEMKWALPLQIGGGIIGAGLWLTSILLR